jgi:hypothetical protein
MSIIIQSAQLSVVQLRKTNVTMQSRPQTLYRNRNQQAQAIVSKQPQHKVEFDDNSRFTSSTQLLLHNPNTNMFVMWYYMYVMAGWQGR